MFRMLEFENVCILFGANSKDNQILTENMLLQQCENSKESTLLLLYKLCILVEFGYKGNENLQVLK